MKRLTLLVAALLAPAMLLFSTSTDAQGFRGGGHQFHRGGHDFHRGGHHFRGGVFFQFGYPGWPAYWGPPYYYPYYYPYYGYAGPIVYGGSPPVTYVERDDVEYAPGPVWWYWCADAKRYYPYVRDCPGGWQRVPPQPVR